MATFSDFEDDILIALYQERVSFEDDEWVSFLKIRSKYGLDAKPGWLIDVFKDLLSRGLISGPAGARIDEMAIGKITGAGMRYVEEKHGSIGGVGIIMPPVDDSVVPASDRIVALDHNAPPYMELVQALGQLRNNLEKANDVGGLTENGTRTATLEVSELEAAISKPLVRPERIKRMAADTLEWIAREAAGAVVGAGALAALALVGKLLGFY